MPFPRGARAHNTCVFQAVPLFFRALPLAIDYFPRRCLCSSVRFRSPFFTFLRVLPLASCLCRVLPLATFVLASVSARSHPLRVLPLAIHCWEGFRSPAPVLHSARIHLGRAYSLSVSILVGPTSRRHRLCCSARIHLGRANWLVIVKHCHILQSTETRRVLRKLHAPLSVRECAADYVRRFLVFVYALFSSCDHPLGRANLSIV